MGESSAHFVCDIAKLQAYRHTLKKSSANRTAQANHSHHASVYSPLRILGTATGKVNVVSPVAPKIAWSIASAAEYQKLRSLFFSALAGLARRGYAIAPDEGLDLIHDFFVEAWPSMVERHDPRQARLSTYAYGAFIQFARARIVRLRRWGKQLDLPAPPETESDTETKLDVTRLRRAFDSLDQGDRDLLDARFAQGQSERELAKALGLTRYRVRERLVEALAGLVSRLQDKALAESSDWAIAVAIWRDGRSIADIAAAMKLTESQVRARKRRILEALTRVAPPSAEHARRDECLRNS